MRAGGGVPLRLAKYTSGRGGGGGPPWFGQIYERGGGGGGGGGVPLAFRQIYERETLAFRHMRAELRSLPRCHSIYLVTYLPCAHIKKKSSEPKGGFVRTPSNPPAWLYSESDSGVKHFHNIF